MIRKIKFASGALFAMFGILSVAFGAWLLDMPLWALLRDCSRRVPVPEPPPAPSIPARRAEMMH